MGSGISAANAACCARLRRSEEDVNGNFHDFSDEPEAPKHQEIHESQKVSKAVAVSSSEPMPASLVAKQTTPVSVSHLHADPRRLDLTKSTQSSQSLNLDPDRARAKEIEKASGQVATACQKFPMHATSFFGTGGAKDRFVAAVPADEVVPDTDWSMYVRRWRRGKLGYWSDKDSYARREAPKGHLDLLSITKVSIPEGGTPEDVSVKHRDVESNQVLRLVLRFPDARKAEAWRTAMRTLRGLLQ